jgi:MoaA/NifB/PqqE/SkfB family radical SAM enzyme
MRFNYLKYFLKILGYKSFRYFAWPKMMPSNAVFSVTNLCNSRCRTCYIWEKYQQNPGMVTKNELTTEQWLKVWKSMGKINFCVWTGGEPFLRPDALSLLEGLYQNCQPEILVICHNGSMPNRYRKILNSFLSQKIKSDVTINLSLDGIGKDHDEIRGMAGNWEKLVETIKITKELQKKYKNLNLGIHTVVSKWNYRKVPEIYNYVVDNFNPDSFKMEPSELRFELGTMGMDILPKKKNLAKVIRSYSTQKNTTKLIDLVRRIYIDKYIKGDGLPCYAAFNHTQITTNGNVWICCMMADNYPMGNLHEVEYDFRKIWFSPRAQKIRKLVKARELKNCQGCYLAVAANTSIPQNLFLTFRYWLRGLFVKGD